jgi:PAS domain S-box-containing protein
MSAFSPLELADAMPLIVWTHDAAGVASYFNRCWTEYTGRTQEETVRVGAEASIHPEDRQRVLDGFVAARATGERFTEVYRLRGRGGAYRWHEAHVVPLRKDTGVVTMWVGAAVDVDDRHRAAEEQRYLAQAGEVLASSLDLQRTLGDVARLLVPRLADWCAVDLLDDSGVLDRATVAHVDPAKVELGWQLWRTNPPRPDAPHGAYAAIRAGRPELLDISEELLAQAVPEERTRALLRGLGLRTSICAPLRARGRDLGAVTLVTSESGRVYGERDVTFAREVAARISLAIDNARLFEEACAARGAAEAMAADVLGQSRVVEAELLAMRAERDGAVAELARSARDGGPR